MPLREKRHRLPHADGWSRGAACAACSTALLLGACSTVRAPAPSPVAAEEGGRPVAQAAPVPRPSGNVPALPPAGSGRGGYYLDDGPGDAPPPNLEAVPNAEPKIEPYSTRGNKPYVVFGKTYVPVTDNQPMKQRGIGSWYGKKFHGQKTSSGELYDMYKMTAAHPTLPIPSYARVTNLKNGAQVIVRVNDRGPFHSSRIIDLSYTAAFKLGYIGHGSSELEVERLLPDEIARINAQARSGPAIAAMKPAAPVSPVILAAAVPVSVTTGAAQAPSGMAAPDSISLDDFLKMQVADKPAAPPADASLAAVASPAQGGMPAALPASSPPSPVMPAGMPIRVLAATPTALPGTLSAAMPSPAPLAGLAPGDAGATLASGIYLQLGAYARSANAEQLRDQLLQRWPAGVPLPQVRQSGALYRLVSGPYADRHAATIAARQVGENPLARPLIVTR